MKPYRSSIIQLELYPVSHPKRISPKSLSVNHCQQQKRERGHVTVWPWHGWKSLVCNQQLPEVCRGTCAISGADRMQLSFSISGFGLQRLSCNAEIPSRAQAGAARVAGSRGSRGCTPGQPAAAGQGRAQGLCQLQGSRRRSCLPGTASTSSRSDSSRPIKGNSQRCPSLLPRLPLPLGCQAQLEPEPVCRAAVPCLCLCLLCKRPWGEGSGAPPPSSPCWSLLPAQPGCCFPVLAVPGGS